jgi:hypothetical protein
MEALPERLEEILPALMAGDEKHVSRALEMATALDRLNLEIRRQMTLLRNQIEQS